MKAHVAVVKDGITRRVQRREVTEDGPRTTVRYINTAEKDVADLRVTVDVAALAFQLGGRALSNKRHKATAVGGAVTVEAVNVRRLPLEGAREEQVP